VGVEGEAGTVAHKELSVTTKKEARTARELEDLINERRCVFIKVHKAPAYGWHPTVVVSRVRPIHSMPNRLRLS
jgi:hypothetical protein